MFAFFRRLSSSYRSRWLFRLFLLSLGLVLFTGLFYLPSGSQAIRNARIIEIVDKPETLQVLIDQVQAETGDEASLGQRILTQKDARVGLKLTRAAGIRLGRNSAFTVGSQCMQLEQGKALIFAAKGCIGSVIATNRGTIYVLERSGQQGVIKVLEGSVLVFDRTIPFSPAVVVNQGQQVSVRATGEIEAVRPIAQLEFESILSGELFQDFRAQLPNSANLSVVLRQLTNPVVPSVPLATPIQASAAQTRETLFQSTRERLQDQTTADFSEERPRRRRRRRFFARSRSADYREVSSSENFPQRRRRSRIAARRPRYNPVQEERVELSRRETPSYREPIVDQSSAYQESPVDQEPFRDRLPERSPDRSPEIERPQLSTSESFDPDRVRRDLYQKRDEIRQNIREQFGRDTESVQEQSRERTSEQGIPRFDIDFSPRQFRQPRRQ
jgi:hypothetical protein